VGLESWPEATADRESLQRQIWQEARQLLGETGSAELDLTVVSGDVSGGTGEAIVRTRRGELERARAVLACLTRVDGDPIGLRVRGVSGTVRACEEKYMGRQPKVAQRDVVFRNATRSACVRGDRVDVRTGDGFTGATTLDLE